MSAVHSGPRVSRALAPRSLGSDFRSKVDLVPRAPVWPICSTCAVLGSPIRWN